MSKKIISITQDVLHDLLSMGNFATIDEFYKEVEDGNVFLNLGDGEEIQLIFTTKADDEDGEDLV